MARKSRKPQAMLDTALQEVEKKVAIYIRLSHDDKNKEQTSTENQRRIAEQHLLSIPELGTPVVYEDCGFTGSNTNRPQFQKMLADIENGLIECVIVKDHSRLGRNSLDTIYYIDEYFPLRGVRYIAVTDSFDSFLSESGVMVSLINVINESYSMDISRKIKAQKQQAIKSGTYVGRNPPHGYCKERKEICRLEVDETSAPLVQELFERAGKGETLHSILLSLNERKEPTPSDYQKALRGLEILPKNRKKWSYQTLERILQSKMYLGHMVQGKTENFNRVTRIKDPSEYIIVKNTHPPLISEELFEKVQANLENKRYKSRDYHDVKNPFAGKLYCGCCKYPLYRRNRLPKKKETPKFVYSCSSKLKYGKDTCSYPQPFKIYEEDLWNTLRSLLEIQSEILLGKELSLLKKEDEFQNREKQVATQLKNLEKELKTKQKFLRGLYENLISDVITEVEYTELRGTYEQEIFQIKQEFLSISKEQEDLAKEKLNLTAWSKELRVPDLELNGEVIDRFFRKIVMYEGKRLEVEFNFQFPLIDEVLCHE